MEGLTIAPAPSTNDNADKKLDSNFYKDAAMYWAHIPPTVDGMLGGFGFVSSIDIQTSGTFIKNLFKSKNPPGRQRALDCGAGIGRISKYLLLEKFEKVDLVEQNPAFLEQATSFIGNNRHLGNMYCSGLQDFTPEPYAYDVIWCQWVLGHIMDEDLTYFLQKCKHGLKKNGVIVVKENVTKDGQTEIDTTDSSVTRSLADLKLVLESAGLKCIRCHRQERFPRVLYPVYILAMRPLSATGGKERKKSHKKLEERGDDVEEKERTLDELEQKDDLSLELEEKDDLLHKLERTEGDLLEKHEQVLREQADGESENNNCLQLSDCSKNSCRNFEDGEPKSVHLDHDYALPSGETLLPFDNPVQ